MVTVDNGGGNVDIWEWFGNDLKSICKFVWIAQGLTEILMILKIQYS